MKLTVLGGSAATPNPNDASAGYLIQSGDTAILVDCGSGVVAKLRAHLDPRALSAVIVSHLHSDHVVDLVALRYGLQYAPPGPGAPIPLYLPPGGIAFLERLGEVFAVGNENAADFWSGVFTPIEYAPFLEHDAKLDVGALQIGFRPMVHYIPVWALRVEERSSGRALTYSADTGPTAPLAEFAAGSDLLLCEATLLEQVGDQPERWGHLTAREAGLIAQEAPVGRLVLTHLWTELGFDNYLSNAKAVFDGPVDLARSGATFVI